MRKTTLPLAVLAALAIAPALAQQYPTYPPQSEIQRSPGGSAATGGAVTFPDADSVQQAELAPAPPPSATAIEQQALVDDNSADFPLLRDEHMSAPMTGLEEGARFENYTGVPQPDSVVRSGDIPGLEPGFPIENLLD